MPQWLCGQQMLILCSWKAHSLPWEGSKLKMVESYAGLLVAQVVNSMGTPAGVPKHIHTHTCMTGMGHLWVRRVSAGMGIDTGTIYFIVTITA